MFQADGASNSVQRAVPFGGPGREVSGRDFAARLVRGPGSSLPRGCAHSLFSMRMRVLLRSAQKTVRTDRVVGLDAQLVPRNAARKVGRTDRDSGDGLSTASWSKPPGPANRNSPRPLPALGTAVSTGQELNAAPRHKEQRTPETSRGPTGPAVVSLFSQKPNLVAVTTQDVVTAAKFPLRRPQLRTCGTQGQSFPKFAEPAPER